MKKDWLLLAFVLAMGVAWAYGLDNFAIGTRKSSPAADEAQYYRSQPGTTTVATFNYPSGGGYTIPVHVLGLEEYLPKEVLWSGTIPTGSRLRFQYITPGGATRYVEIKIPRNMQYGITSDGYIIKRYVP